MLDELHSASYIEEYPCFITNYQSIAKEYKKIKAIDIQLINTINSNASTWTLSEIVYNHVIKIFSQKITQRERTSFQKSANHPTADRDKMLFLSTVNGN